MNLRELANELGLSPTTVSVCLHGSPGKLGLRTETVTRVREYAERKGYVPNRLARRIFHPESQGVIGILVRRDSSLERNEPVVQEAMARLNASGREYTVVSYEEERFVESVQMLHGMAVRHIICLGFMHDEPFERLEPLKGLELYVPDSYNEPKAIPDCVRFCGFCDRTAFYRELRGRLERAGLAPLVCNLSIAQRLADLSLCPGEDFGETSGAENCFELGRNMVGHVERLWRERRCRTILLGNDSVALGLMGALLDRGVRIPEDLAIVGFNDAPYCAYVRPALSTVRLPILPHVHAVLDHLLDGAELPRVVCSMPMLVLRGTTPDSLQDENCLKNKQEKKNA